MSHNFVQFRTQQQHLQTIGFFFFFLKDLDRLHRQDAIMAPYENKKVNFYRYKVEEINGWKEQAREQHPELNPDNAFIKFCWGTLDLRNFFWWNQHGENVSLAMLSLRNLISYNCLLMVHFFP